MLDTPRAYLQTRANGWGHGDALKTAALVRQYGGLDSIKSMVFSAGGLNVSSAGYWPNTFRKLTDSWPERVGFDPSGVSLDEIWRNSTAQACLAWIQRTFPEPRIRVLRGEGEDAEEIRGHPLTRLINRPNPYYTAHRLWQVTLADWWITGRGNAYWQIIRGRSGEPVELWHVPAVEMEPRWPQSGAAFISHYDRTVNGKRSELAPEDVVHFRFGQDPFNARKGWSPILAGAAEITNLNEGAAYRVSILQNHGVPSYSLTPKDEHAAQAMDKPQVEALERLWKSKHTGRSRGSLFIPNFSAQLERVGFSPQELDIRKMLEWDADVVCALFGLNSMVVNLPSGEGHRTYANQAEAREAAFESNIVPTGSLLAADLELQLLAQFPGYQPDRHVSFDYSCVRVLQDDQDKLYTRLDKAVVSKWVRPSEARAKVGLTPDPELDARAMEQPEPKALPPGQDEDETPPNDSA